MRDAARDMNEVPGFNDTVLISQYVVKFSLKDQGELLLVRLLVKLWSADPLPYRCAVSNSVR